MHVATVVGARPQFVKAAPVSAALRAAGHAETLIHTGQHYDHALSQVFFDELGLAPPDVDLGIGSGPHGRQTGAMLAALEEVLDARRPDWVLVYGDTNSTLAAALAAVKLGLPVAHVEAGLRSFNRAMPEEHNRVLTDHCADLLLCPTRTAFDRLHVEGLGARARLVGDTMLDAVRRVRAAAETNADAVARDLGLDDAPYLVATLHRPYNTDDPATLARLLRALDALDEPVVLPVHPRTRARIDALEDAGETLEFANLRVVPPVGHRAMIGLLLHARMLLTDSGGLQKEAYFLGVPCVTLRPETEWVETVDAGWNVLVGSDPARITAAVRAPTPPTERPAVFGDGHAAEAIVAELTAALDRID